VSAPTKTTHGIPVVVQQSEETLVDHLLGTLGSSLAKDLVDEEQELPACRPGLGD
jgi:hypothetical protein